MNAILTRDSISLPADLILNSGGANHKCTAEAGLCLWKQYEDFLV